MLTLGVEGTIHMKNLLLTHTGKASKLHMFWIQKKHRYHQTAMASLLKVDSECYNNQFLLDYIQFVRLGVIKLLFTFLEQVQDAVYYSVQGINRT